MDKTVIESYQNLGVAYGKMENFAASNDYLNKGLALAEKNNTKQNLVVIYQQLASNYEQSGNYKKALGYTDLYHNLKDSIFNQNKVELIEELEKKYETAELKAAQSQLELEKEQYIKEAELDAIKNDQLIQEKELESLRAKRNQNYLITSIIIAIIVAAAGLLYFFQFKKRKQAELNHVELSEQNKRLQVENQYKDSELKAIKAQMNPHFIFNALNSIQDYIILNEKELASDYLGMFADLMRLYLDQSDQNLISVAEEIKSLKLYIELEALRQDGIEFEVKCNDEDLLQVELPPMLIQPYVENSIKHGLWHKKGDKQLTVSFYEENEMLHCEVLDNGIGITESKRINENRPKHRSFSTDANKNRLQIIQEKHGNDLSIEMTECRQGVEITGTKVIIKIPLNLS
jgi:LytS/YehU family sensor histidine kinase